MVNIIKILNLDIIFPLKAYSNSNFSHISQCGNMTVQPKQKIELDVTQILTSPDIQARVHINKAKNAGAKVSRSLSPYPLILCAIISEARGYRGAPEDEKLSPADRARRRSEGENVPGHHGGLRHLLGSPLLRHARASPGDREHHGIRGRSHARHSCASFRR